MILHRAVPYSLPSITEAEIAAVVSVLKSGWLAFGPDKERFEEEFAASVGVAHAVSTNSCTSALELALVAAGIRGEVLVPSFTWVATANAVLNAGATPVFCDVDETTRNVTGKSLAARVTRRTEAVICVHYAGQPCNMDEITSVCRQHGLFLLEDSAQTIGASWRGRQVGSFGVGCFSFYPTKAMTTGEGGMLTTDDARFAERVRVLASHGVPSTPPLSGKVHLPWSRAAVEPGHNFRLPNLLAALGRVQLGRLTGMNAARAACARRYDQLLQPLHGRIRPPRVAEGATHVYQMYTVQAIAKERDALLRHLWERGVGANIHFDPPVHLQPLYRERSRERIRLPVTERLAQEVISLPIYPGLGDEDQEWVARCIHEGVEAIGQSRATSGDS
jgi:dTDP-4-amino-4,6-dideoxygalactose transaminase